MDAAAVTEEVSLTAVPAKMPKASPLVVENPSSAPRAGKNRAASMLKKKITEIACATSSSSASITGGCCSDCGAAADRGTDTDQRGDFAGNVHDTVQHIGDNQRGGNRCEDDRQGLLSGFQNNGKV